MIRNKSPLPNAGNAAGTWCALAKLFVAFAQAILHLQRSRPAIARQHAELLEVCAYSALTQLTRARASSSATPGEDAETSAAFAAAQRALLTLALFASWLKHVLRLGDVRERFEPAGAQKWPHMLAQSVPAIDSS